MDHDVKIVGGTVVDGTGASGFAADVAVRDGQVVAIGDAAGEADEVIDATGRIVAPGFVDMHTHYDAQILWDRTLSCSPWHGVTTVVIGSCGFGVAPMAPENRETAMRTLEKVEGMAYQALATGLGADWPFVSYPDYLDVIEQRGSAVNVASYVGHTPLRLTVMGGGASERAATESEIEQMAELVREAMAVGAIGLSTSHAAAHHGAGGKPVPSRLASWEEIDALLAAVAQSGRGVFQAAMGRNLFNDEFARLWDRHEVPITWTALLADMTGPGSHDRYARTAADQQAAGRQIYPQVACRPIMFDFTFAEPYPFELLDLFGDVMHGDQDAKASLYANEGFRSRFRSESEPGAKNVNAGWYGRTVISRCPTDATLEERPLDEVAAERGTHPVDLALDLSLDTDMGARFRLAFLNHNEAAVQELITDPHTIVTLSDAGAHADQLCDAGYSTHLLGHWVRDVGALSLESAVHALTQKPAEFMGLRDRGLLAEGRPADIVVFDPDTVAAGPLRRVADLPGGAERLVSDAVGVDAVMVNGAVLRAGDEDRFGVDDELPGALLRGGSASR